MECQLSADVLLPPRFFFSAIVFLTDGLAKTLALGFHNNGLGPSMREALLDPALLGRRALQGQGSPASAPRTGFRLVLVVAVVHALSTVIRRSTERHIVQSAARPEAAFRQACPGPRQHVSHLTGQRPNPIHQRGKY